MVERKKKDQVKIAEGNGQVKLLTKQLEKIRSELETAHSNLLLSNKKAEELQITSRTLEKKISRLNKALSATTKTSSVLSEVIEEVTTA